MNIVEQAEARVIIWVGERCEWNRTQMGEVLGISSRCIRYKLHKYRKLGLCNPGIDGRRVKLGKRFYNSLRRLYGIASMD